MNKNISTFINAILGGFMIGVGGIIYLQCSSKLFGAFLFSLGLLSIVNFGLNLYTGKVGHIVDQPSTYIFDVLIILLGNAVGTFLCAKLFLCTKFADGIKETVSPIVEGKISDTLLSSLILAFFCGVLMFIAVDGFKNCCADGKYTVATFIVVMPVVVFILAGFNHSIADMFYVFLNGLTLKSFYYIVTVVIGNAIGGMTIPLCKKICK